MFRDLFFVPSLTTVQIFEEGARTIWDVELRSLLPLLPEKVLEVAVKSDGHAWTITSSQGGGRNVRQNIFLSTSLTNIFQPRLHATGFMTTETVDEDIEPIDLASIRDRCTATDITSAFSILLHDWSHHA